MSIIIVGCGVVELIRIGSGGGPACSYPHHAFAKRRGLIGVSNASSVDPKGAVCCGPLNLEDAVLPFFVEDAFCFLKKRCAS